MCWGLIWPCSCKACRLSLLAKTGLAAPTWSSLLGNTSLTPHRPQLPDGCPAPLSCRDTAKSCMSSRGTQEVSATLHHHHPHRSPHSQPRGHAYCRRPHVCIPSSVFPRNRLVLPRKPWVGLCHASDQLHCFMPVSLPTCLPQLFAEDFWLRGRGSGKSCLFSGWDDGCYCCFRGGPCGGFCSDFLLPPLPSSTKLLKPGFVPSRHHPQPNLRGKKAQPLVITPSITNTAVQCTGPYKLGWTTMKLITQQQLIFTVLLPFLPVCSPWV